MGVPREQLDVRSKAATPELDDMAVAPHLADAVQLFAHLRGQWRTQGIEGKGVVFMGLDHQAIRSTAWLAGFKWPKDRARLFGQLKRMEVAALKVLNR